MRYIIGIMLGLFVVLVVGSIMLEEFPALQPFFGEVKQIGSSLYNTSLAKYGTIATIAIIFGLVVLIGSSKKI